MFFFFCFVLFFCFVFFFCFYKTKVVNLFLKYFLNNLNFIKLISKPDFVERHVFTRNWYVTYMLVFGYILQDMITAQWITCLMVLDLWHNNYRIVTGYKWQVVASLVRVHKPAQGLASAPYWVLEGSTKVL